MRGQARSGDWSGTGGQGADARMRAALLLGRPRQHRKQKATVRMALLGETDANIGGLRAYAARTSVGHREDCGSSAARPARWGAAGRSADRPTTCSRTRRGRCAAPPSSLGESKEQRTKGRAAWETWWKANEAKVDLTKSDVDLQAVNPAALAKDTIRKMMDAWLVKGTCTTARAVGLRRALPNRRRPAAMPRSARTTRSDSLGRSLHGAFQDPRRGR